MNDPLFKSVGDIAMITTKAFKEQHDLSDSAFKRLVRKAKRQYPGGEFTRRINSTQWEVLHPAILESLISATVAEPEFTDSTMPANKSASHLLQPLNLVPLHSLVPSHSRTVEVIPTSKVSTIADLHGQRDRLMQGQSEVAMALEVVQQTRQLVGYVLSVQRSQTTVDTQQVTQLEDAAFELQVHADCLRREDRRTSIEQGYRDQRRSEAQTQVVQMRDFFARRTEATASTEVQP
jgi:hypothetical protein